MKQQEVFSAALMRAPASPIFIPSQCDNIFEEVQPIRSDEKSEEAETGITPSPASITASTKMNNRRIVLHSTKFIAENLHLLMIALVVYEDCEQDHKPI